MRLAINQGLKICFSTLPFFQYASTVSPFIHLNYYFISSTVLRVFCTLWSLWNNQPYVWLQSGLCYLQTVVNKLLSVNQLPGGFKWLSPYGSMELLLILLTLVRIELSKGIRQQIDISIEICSISHSRCSFYQQLPSRTVLRQIEIFKKVKPPRFFFL